MYLLVCSEVVLLTLCSLLNDDIFGVYFTVRYGLFSFFAFILVLLFHSPNPAIAFQVHIAIPVLSPWFRNDDKKNRSVTRFYRWRKERIIISLSFICSFHSQSFICLFCPLLHPQDGIGIRLVPFRRREVLSQVAHIADTGVIVLLLVLKLCHETIATRTATMCSIPNGDCAPGCSLHLPQPPTHWK